MDTGVYSNLIKKASRILSRHPKPIEIAQGFACRILYKVLGREPEFKTKPFDHPLADQMAYLLSGESLEQALYWIGTTYAALLPPETRQRNGVFYTPPVLADRLLDQVSKQGIDWSHAKVLDPASGCGVFLLLSARRMLRASSLTSGSDLAKRLFGRELDPFSAWISDVFIQEEISRTLPAPSSQTPQICFTRVMDSLRDFPQEHTQFDLVVGNPPYGKIKLSAKERDMWKRGIYGHANLYGLFTDLAVRSTKPGGVIGFVTPTSFLGGRYFHALRTLLAEEAPPVSFDFITKRNGVFQGVLQETMLSVFRKATDNVKTSVSYVAVKSPDRIDVVKNGAYPLARDGSPWVVPRNRVQSKWMRQCGHFTHRLKDYGYRVSTGPLVWNRHKDAISTSKISGSVPIIWAECVPQGGSGEFRYTVSGRNHVPWYRPASSQDSNLVRKSCVLVQRTTALEQDRRLIAAKLPESFLAAHGGCVTVENHLNMVRPLKETPPLVDPDIIAALLNSRVLDAVFRCVNGSTAVSAYELEALPMPPPEALSALINLVRDHSDREIIEHAIEKIYAGDDAKAAA